MERRARKRWMLVVLLLSACSDGGPSAGTSLPSSEASTTVAITGEPTVAPGTAATTTAVPVDSLPEPLASPVAPTGDQALDESLRSMARFVEATRGRPFTDQVVVTFLDDAAFEAVVAEGWEGPDAVEAMRSQGRLLEILGLLPEGTDFVELVRISQREGVVGLYRPDTGELWVRGTDATPLVRTTIVHELTHALDDQWFSLDEAAVGDADEMFARDSLAEGTASFVESAYRDLMPAADIVAAQREANEYWAQMEVPDWPLSVTELSESVYSLGLVFVDRLVGEGGMDAVDEAYRHPPRSTEQLLHPDRYLAAHDPVEVAAPDVAGEVVAAGVMGEWSLVELLNAELAPSDARAAAEGWGGDHFVVTVDGGTECVTMDIRADSAEEADELARGVSRWAVRADGAHADRVDTSTVRLEVCRAA